MEATRVVAVRHGETHWNAQARIQGQLDIGLNDLGRAQAARVAGALAEETIDAIYTSDLRRAADTARALAEATGIEAHLDAGLRERAFGRFEGLSFAEVERQWPEDSARWRRREPDFGPGGGEPLRVFYARCISAVTRLAARHAGGTIVVFAHGGVLDCLYRAAAGIELGAARTWALPNGAINRLLYTGERFTLVGWGDVGEL